jgi:hypothetical protein
MSEKSVVHAHGIGPLSLLGVAFVVLKLTGYIDWSWWYVTMPFWGGLVLIIVFLVITFVLYFLAALIKKINKG